jgi:hypothetical protein
MAGCEWLPAPIRHSRDLEKGGHACMTYCVAMRLDRGLVFRDTAPAPATTDDFDHHHR